MTGGVAAPGMLSLTHWGAHLAFWAFYMAFRTAAAQAMNMAPSEEWANFPFLANRSVVVAGYFVTTALLLGVFLQRRFTIPVNLRYGILFAGAIGLMPVMQVVEENTARLFGYGVDSEEKAQFLTYAFMYGWALLLWAASQAIIDYHRRVVEQARAINRAQSLAYDAQLRMLHYQFNPHFLFNTLNAISSLVLDRRTDQAERILLQLSGFLRYSLDRRPNELATLSEEVEAQRKYLEIEQARFGEKMKVSFDIAPDAARARLPSLILQPLLENAIKYAITPSAKGGRIEVRAWRDGDLLRVRVADDGPGLGPQKPGARRGLGLANARERLSLIYGERAGLVAQSRPEGGYAAEIWAPFEEEDVSEPIVARASR
ncbi:MAG: histidine kinase [Hyphomonadaceae bacterium]|nr:histidine kinase [Hyphomonadaceae bacterium]